jgi:hypothetical protein
MRQPLELFKALYIDSLRQEPLKRRFFNAKLVNKHYRQLWLTRRKTPNVTSHWILFGSYLSSMKTPYAIPMRLSSASDAKTTSKWLKLPCYCMVTPARKPSFFSFSTTQTERLILAAGITSQMQN